MPASDDMLASDDPLAFFRGWFAEAEAAEPDLPDAASLATVSAEGRPSIRVVLVRLRDDGTFEFHTNRESRKGLELAQNPHAALTWHWKSQGRQVRVEGDAAPMTDEESDDYWQQRARGSQISATISAQSRPVDSREELEVRRRELESSLGYFPVPRPPHWGGYRVTPLLFEFWVHRDDRLHDRLEFRRQRAGEPWTAMRLQP